MLVSHPYDRFEFESIEISDAAGAQILETKSGAERSIVDTHPYLGELTVNDSRSVVGGHSHT